MSRRGGGDGFHVRLEGVRPFALGATFHGCGGYGYRGRIDFAETRAEDGGESPHSLTVPRGFVEDGLCCRRRQDVRR